MKTAIFLVLVVAAAAVAGCIGDDGPVTEAGSDGVRVVSWMSGNRTLVEPAAPAGFNLTGVGWGQFTVLATESLSLRVVHPELDLTSPFNDFNQKYYGPGNYTLIHATDGSASREFAFLGRNAGFHHPSQESLDNGPVFSLSPGQWTVTVANSVPGYQLSLGAGSNWYDFPLGPRPGFFGGAAPRSNVGGIDAQTVRALSEYHFVQELPAQPPSLIALLAWESEFAVGALPMVHAEVGSSHFALEALGTPVSADGLPEGGLGTGSYTGGARHIVEETRKTGDWQAVFAIQRTGVVLGVHDEGMTVVAMPLA